VNTILLAAWLTIGAFHLGLPLAYFAVMKRVASRPEDSHVKPEVSQQPTVSILVPTYNEASVMERKLANLSLIKYPREKLEVIVVDGGSTDNTPSIARGGLDHFGLKGQVIEEGERKGKAAGLNSALRISTGEVVCISDAECEWNTRALENAVKYLSDPMVGSVSGVHSIVHQNESSSTHVEDSYRSIYRMLRVAESKIHSTPVAEGELQLFRRRELSAFDTTVGGDDTDAALNMVSKGLRAISAEDVIFYEPTPRSWRGRFRQKIRRGQHVMQAFLKHRDLLFSNRNSFTRIIFPMEFFLYLLNPLLFVPFLAMTAIVFIEAPIVLFLSIVGLVIVIAIPSLRQAGMTYVSNNLTMLAAILQEARGAKQLQWTKIEETRDVTRLESFQNA